MRLPDRLIILDLETTDLQQWKTSGELPEAVEIGGILIDSGLTVLDQFSTLVRPKHIENFTPAVSALTGIQQAELYRAPEWGEITKKLVQFTHGKSLPIYAFGGFLDAAVLQKEYIRIGHDVPHRMPIFDLQTLFVSETLARGYTVTSVSLRAFCALFDVETKGQHRALKDCEICLDILKKLQPRKDDFEFQLYEF